MQGTLVPDNNRIMYNMVGVYGSFMLLKLATLGHGCFNVGSVIPLLLYVFGGGHAPWTRTPAHWTRMGTAPPSPWTRTPSRWNRMWTRTPSSVSRGRYVLLHN